MTRVYEHGWGLIEICVFYAWVCVPFRANERRLRRPDSRCVEHIITMLRDGVTDVSLGIQSKLRCNCKHFSEKGNDTEREVRLGTKGMNVP